MTNFIQKTTLQQNKSSFLIQHLEIATYGNDLFIKRNEIVARFTPRKKCPCSELFWSAFFPHSDRIRRDTRYLPIFILNARKCGKNCDQNNSKYEPFLRSKMLHQSSAYYAGLIVRDFVKRQIINFIGKLKNSLKVNNKSVYVA